MKYNFQGLTDEQARESRIQHGSNELNPAQTESFWDKLLSNFKDPIIIILCVALAVMLVLSIFEITEWYEALAIAIAVTLATFVSTYSEFKNESSFQKLQEEALRTNCNVFRNEHLVSIPVSEIVAGDYVLLQSGDKIPADGMIVHGHLKVNQASLTGESESVEKDQTDDISSEEKNLSSHFWLFRGSVIDDGEAIMKVISVGIQTFYGQLASELGDKDDRLSPLQVKLKDLAKLISKFGYLAATLIFVTFLFNKILIANHFNAAELQTYFAHIETVLLDVLDAGILAIIIVVAAVPEGLPMMIAIVLSLNMRKLLREKVLVRKLLGIETSGSLNILFTDKTGTLTKGRFEPAFLLSGSKIKYDDYKSVPGKLREMLSFAILENSASVISPNGEIEGGNQSGRALLSFIDKDELIRRAKSNVKVKKSILFNSARKFSASQVVHDGSEIQDESQELTLVKGAPELLLTQCDRYYNEEGNQVPFDKKTYMEKLDQVANDGTRLIAVAYSHKPLLDDESLPGNCCLLGVVGIQDEIREESAQSIIEAHKAGIQVVMLTGDRKGTATAIAREIGLLKGESDAVLTSEELSQYSDEEVKLLLPALRVIARALPTDKSRLVRIAKEMGKVVGMTGDGVNDSVALKRSDVGFAMGSGSEVSKEASDIVIMDDNISSITNAVRYGRTIFKSIRKFIVFQLTVNLSAVGTVFLGPFFGIDFPLTIIQLLWINIIMDTLAAIAFGGEPALRRFMHEQPVKRDEDILTRDMKTAIVVGGIYITFFSLFFLDNDMIRDLFHRNGVFNEKIFLTAFFNLFVFMITFNSLNARTEKLNIFENIGHNKGFLRILALIIGIQVFFSYFGGEILRAAPLQPREWGIIILLALTIIPVDLFRKFIYKRVTEE